MNDIEGDEFLRGLRQAPRPEFTEALFERISQPRGGSMLDYFHSNAIRSLGKYAVALGLAVAILGIASPDVRAGVAQTISKIGGYTFVVSDRGWDSAPHPASAQQPPQAGRVGLAEARSRVPYSFVLPTWLPNGVALKEDATEVAGTSAIVYFVAADPDVSAFVWRTYQGQGGTGLVGNGATETVTVNGVPALLIRGIWDGRTGEWSRPHLVTLRWSQSDVSYEVHANINTGISVEDLIRIAESAR